MNDRPVEATEDMIQAGFRVWTANDPDEVNIDEILKAIWEAMFSAYKCDKGPRSLV